MTTDDTPTHVAYYDNDGNRLGTDTWTLRRYNHPDIAWALLCTTNRRPPADTAYVAWLEDDKVRLKPWTLGS